MNTRAHVFDSVLNLFHIINIVNRHDLLYFLFCVQTQLLFVVIGKVRHQMLSNDHCVCVCVCVFILFDIPNLLHLLRPIKLTITFLALTNGPLNQTIKFA